MMVTGISDDRSGNTTSVAIKTSIRSFRVRYRKLPSCTTTARVQFSSISTSSQRGFCGVLKSSVPPGTCYGVSVFAGAGVSDA